MESWMPWGCSDVAVAAAERAAPAHKDWSVAADARASTIAAVLAATARRIGEWRACLPMCWSCREAL